MGQASFDFAGEQVVVTGASRGIGRAVAEAFARAGADVTIVSSSQAIVAVAEAIAETTGRNVMPVRCDITNSHDVAALADALGPVDVLVNNAGLERMTPIAARDEEVDETFQRVVDTNVTGTYRITREIVPKMKPGGRIIITASIWARTAVAEFSAYCASKHANLGFARSLARELGPRGIRVNAVCPGWVRTEASMRTLALMAERCGRTESEIAEEISGAQIMPGLMEPDDVAGIYLYLASDGARNVTGQAWNIDRGEVMS